MILEEAGPPAPPPLPPGELPPERELWPWMLVLLALVLAGLAAAYLTTRDEYAAAGPASVRRRRVVQPAAVVEEPAVEVEEVVEER